MAKHLFLFVFWAGSCCVFGTISAQTPSNSANNKPDYSGEAFVVELDSTQIVFENDGTSTRESSARVRIQSGAGVQRFGVLTFSYQNSTESVEIGYVRVRKPDGSEVSTPPENVQDMAAEITRQAPFYSDLREKHVAVKGLGAGDMLEYQARWRSSKTLTPGQFWGSYNLSHEGIILQQRLQISIPRDRPVKWKSPNFKPAITEEGARRVFTWTNANLQHKSKEQERKDQEQTVYQAVRGKYPPAEIQISSFQSWEEVGHWYSGLQQERAIPTAEIRAKAAELTKGTTDESAKVRAIYNYVSMQFRYIGIAFGIGRYQPHSANEVLGNQYGDCKDKHTLFAALLGAVGVKVYPALISSDHELDPDVPSPVQFDHLISVVTQGDRLTWVDTTPEVAPYGYLIGALRDKRALVIPADKPAILMTSPPDPPSKATQTFRIEARLDENGTLEGKIERSMQGDDNELLLRAAFRNVPMPQWKDLIQRISYATGFAGEVSDATAEAPEKIDEPFRFSYQYTRKDYPDWPNRRITPPIPPIALPSPADEESKPANPIWLGSPVEIRFESHVNLPEGYTPEIPANAEVIEDFAEYHSLSRFKAGVLTTERRLVVKLREVPVNEYEAYKKFSKAVNDDHDVYIGMSTGSSNTNAYQEAIWTLPYSDKPEAGRAYDEARNDFQKNDVNGEIAALKRAVEIDPKFIRAWLWLGEIYKYSRQTDKAVEAYRKAIAVDPRVVVSHKALAMTLLNGKEFEEAVPVLEELIKIAPGDSGASIGLANALAGVKRYQEAAAALESALKLSPEKSELYSQLGSTYLKAGNADKALAAFREALEKDPGSSNYNEISYDLADAGVKLEVALEFAQKAVRMEEEAAGKAGLEDLEDADLGHVNSLAANWDTLGWVYFRMGNFDEAEKYLNAAWTLDQWGIVADHLGQVYEQQHKKQAAIRMYKLALYRYVSEGAHDNEDTEERLRRLSPGSSRSDPNRLTQASEDLYQVQNIKLPQTVKNGSKADFFVILVPDPQTLTAKVKDARFISGAEELRTATIWLKAANFKFTFPDNGHTRVLRKEVSVVTLIQGAFSR